MRTLVFLLALIASNFAFAQTKWTPLEGESAKDFSLKTVSNETVNLKELLKTKPVVLVVLRGWPGYQCPICTKQGGSLISVADEFAKHQVSVLMVYPGPAQDLLDHANEFKEDFNFPANFYFTIDPDYSMINLYNLRWEAEKETAFPSTFIINKEGVIVYSKISHSHGGRSTVEEILEVLDKK